MRDRYTCPSRCCQVEGIRQGRAIHSVYLNGEQIRLADLAERLCVGFSAVKKRYGRQGCLQQSASDLQSEYATKAQRTFTELHPAAPDVNPVASQFLALRW